MLGEVHIDHRQFNLGATGGVQQGEFGAVSLRSHRVEDHALHALSADVAFLKRVLATGIRRRNTLSAWPPAG